MFFSPISYLLLVPSLSYALYARVIAELCRYLNFLRVTERCGKHVAAIYHEVSLRWGPSVLSEWLCFYEIKLVGLSEQYTSDNYPTA